jgi:hypothetical protein
MKIACGKNSQRCKLFVGLSVFALFCAAAQAQAQHRAPVSRPPPMAVPHGPPPGQAHGPPAGQTHGLSAGQAHGPPVGQSVKERWLAMPPDARQNFRRNAELWMQMSPEQRSLMRQRETMRRQVITREADAAVRNSGLQLTPQQRAQFESRYIQERRKVEQTLRQQIEAERQKEIPALIRELKKEFQIDQPVKNPAAKPATSPKSEK